MSWQQKVNHRILKSTTFQRFHCLVLKLCVDDQYGSLCLQKEEEPGPPETSAVFKHLYCFSKDHIIRSICLFTAACYTVQCVRKHFWESLLVVKPAALTSRWKCKCFSFCSPLLFQTGEISSGKTGWRFCLKCIKEAISSAAFEATRL